MKSLIAIVLVFATALFAEQGPLLIQWGQTTPDANLLARHHAHWEACLPFDGIVIPINQKRYAGRYGSTAANILSPEHWPLGHVAFDHRRIDRAEYQHVVDALRSAQFTKFRHNFINLMAYPRMGFAMDWFDDELWGRLLHNVGVLAWVAKESGCKGIWFDTEQYGPPNVWHYTRLCEIMPERAADFETYRAKAVQRGAQFIRAINGPFPGLELVLVFGNCIIHEDLLNHESARGRHFSHARYSLLAPFLDGILAGADETTVVTDGYELSYYYKTEDQFIDGAAIVRDACRAYSLDADRYARRMKVGFGLYPTHHGMFDPADFAQNRFSPDDLRLAVRHAMKHTDRYVWLWNERISFWIEGGPEGRPLPPLQPFCDYENADPAHLTADVGPDNAMRAKDRGLPPAYLDAIREGKRVAKKGQAPGH